MDKKDKEIQTLKEEIASLKNIISLMPGNVFWKDRKGKHLGCNQNNAIALKLNSPEEVIGKSLSELYDLQYAIPIDRYDQEIMAKDQEEMLEENVLDPNGNPIVYLTKKTPLHNTKGDVIGLLGVSVDITDRKKMEEELRIAKEKAEEADQAKSRFISLASHELRIPLSGIIGAANFLHKGGLTPKEEREYLDNLLNAAKYQLLLVNNILDFSKLEADKFELSSEPLNLKAVTEEMVAMLSSPAKEKNIELLIDYGPNIPHKVMGDSQVLRQIISNLINNSIKFTDSGFISISARCIEQTPELAKIEIAVKDTGMGIPKDKLDYVFERFSQVSSVYTRSSSRGGTGLGLSIVKKWVELMGGTIRVESDLGKGSTFYCTFPFPLQDKATEETPWADYASKVKILVVDDTLRGEIICKHVGTRNCESISGDKALETFFTAQEMEQPYDIVLIDAQLRYANPTTILDTIQEKSNHKPLIILLVPSNSLQERQIALKRGFFAVIAKPVQPIAFQMSLTSIWERWEEQNRPKEKYHLKTLVVEDNLLIQRIHKRLLESLGCKVDIADSSQEALDLSQKNNYDIIFMDIGLPEISGVDVIKMIRHRKDASSKTYIVAVTGFSTDEEKKEFLEAGANDIAIKPMEDEYQLREVLERHKEKHIS